MAKKNIAVVVAFPKNMEGSPEPEPEKIRSKFRYVCERAKIGPTSMSGVLYEYARRLVKEYEEEHGEIPDTALPPPGRRLTNM